MLTRFNAGCDCDCCIVYKSEFCKNWYQSVFERKYFGSVSGNPSRMNLNGGSFNQIGAFTEEDIQVWEIRNDACGADLTYCKADDDPKGYKYSQSHYLTPTSNLASSYLSTLAIADKFQWWMYTFWDTCDSTQGAPCWDSANNQPASNQTMIFLFDYIDKNNWTGLQVEYKPDFNSTPGFVERLFEAKLRQQVSGSIALIGEPFEIDLGIGDKKVDVGIEINVDERAACGSSAFAFVKFGTASFNLTYDSLGGDRIGIVQGSPSGVVDSINCGGTNYTIGEGFGIYNWVHQYLNSEKEGCPTYSVPEGCCGDCPDPEFDATFTGFSNGDCDDCESLNDTFTLKRFGVKLPLPNTSELVPISSPFNVFFTPNTGTDFPWSIDEEVPANATEACWWLHELDPYSPIGCVLDITTQHVWEATATLTIYGFGLAKFKIGTGATAYTLWRLYIGWRIRLFVHVDSKLDPDGYEIVNSFEHRLMDGWYYDYTTSATDVDKCVFDGTESWTANDGWEFDISDLNLAVSTLNLDSYCDSSGSLSVENG